VNLAARSAAVQTVGKIATYPTKETGLEMNQPGKLFSAKSPLAG